MKHTYYATRFGTLQHHTDCKKCKVKHRINNALECLCMIITCFIILKIVGGV